MILREIAHARTGDKGDISSICVIVYDPADYPLLERSLGAERVLAWFGGPSGLVKGPVVRYELPTLGALNFVMHGALGGGVTRSLAIDAHGKSLSSSLLAIEIDPQEAYTRN